MSIRARGQEIPLEERLVDGPDGLRTGCEVAEVSGPHVDRAPGPFDRRLTLQHNERLICFGVAEASRRAAPNSALGAVRGPGQDEGRRARIPFEHLSWIESVLFELRLARSDAHHGLRHR